MVALILTRVKSRVLSIQISCTGMDEDEPFSHLTYLGEFLKIGFELTDDLLVS